MAAKRLMTWKQLVDEKGHPYSRVHTDRLEKAGKFPKRLKLGPNKVAWDEAEYDAWVERCRMTADKVA